VHQRYDDILSKIAEEPTWFDEHAVPRYCQFAPDKLVNIHAGETALAEVLAKSASACFASRSQTLIGPRGQLPMQSGREPCTTAILPMLAAATLT
jgi:hypothetical protein